MLDTIFQGFPLPMGVVPILVNAGAALLPSLLAGLASVIALLFQPREMLALFQRRPHIPLMIGLICLGFYFSGGFFAQFPLSLTGQSPAVPPSEPASPQTNWSNVALEIIRQEEKIPPPQNKGPITPTPEQTGLPGRRALYERGGPERTGYAGGPSPAKLVPLWEYQRLNAPILVSPLVSGDRIFAASCNIEGPRTEGIIFCLNATTGDPIWITDTKDGKKKFAGFCSSPALTADEQNLVIGQGLHEDANSELICLNAKNGTVRWLVKTPLHIEGSPAIEGDIAVAGAGAIEGGLFDRPVGHAGTEGNRGYVFGVRISDGKELWRFSLTDPESSPAIDKGIAYIGSGTNGNAVAAIRIASDEDLAARNLKRLAWITHTRYAATGPTTIIGDLILIGCGNGNFGSSADDPKGLVVAFDKSSGKIVWQTEMPDSVLGAIPVQNGKAIVPVRNGELFALEVSTGKIIWRQENLSARIAGRDSILCGPAFTGSHIYATSQGGYLAVIDPVAGAILQRIYINAADNPGKLDLTYSSPFIANGRLYIGSETGGLKAFTSENK